MKKGFFIIAVILFCSIPVHAGNTNIYVSPIISSGYHRYNCHHRRMMRHMPPPIMYNSFRDRIYIGRDWSGRPYFYEPAIGYGMRNYYRGGNINTGFSFRF